MRTGRSASAGGLSGSTRQQHRWTASRAAGEGFHDGSSGTIYGIRRLGERGGALERRARTPASRRRAPCRAARCRAAAGCCCRWRRPAPQARALRIEQRQEVDLPAVVERLRAAERRLGRGRGAAASSARWRSSRERDQRVLDVLERAHDAVLVAQQRFAWPLSAISLIACVRPALKIGIASSAEALVKRAAPRSMLFSSTFWRPNSAPRKSRGKPFRLRLLPARIGGVELRLQRQQIGPALQQRRRLSGAGGRASASPLQGTMLAALNAWSPISTAMR